MDKLKKFIAPRVLQSVDLELEEDLLIGPSTTMTILATGHDTEEVDFAGEWTLD